MTETRTSQTGTLVAGIILVLVGLMLLGGGLHYVFGWFGLWPLILIGIGAVKIAEPRTPKERRDGVVVAAIGALFMAFNTGLRFWSFRRLWPVVLIAVGAWIAMQSFAPNGSATRSDDART